MVEKKNATELSGSTFFLSACDVCFLSSVNVTSMQLSLTSFKQQPPFPRGGGGKPNSKANINVNDKTMSVFRLSVMVCAPGKAS